MPARQLLLDVDVGIDDAVMMLYLAAEPAAEIVAVGSCHGNCSAAISAVNALRVLEAVGLDHVPVALGAESPLADAMPAIEVHGHDGLGDVGFPTPRGAVSGESAVDQILRLSRERSGELDLLAVGTMTNLALALEQDPDVLRRFRTVAILGGYSRAPRPGDAVTVDPNIYKSPDAAERLFAAKAPLFVVPVDTSFHYSELDDDHIERLRSSTTPQGRFAWTILPYYFDFYQRRLGRWSSCMHDPLAAAALLDPILITGMVSRPMYVEPFNDVYRGVGHDGAELAHLPTRDPARIVTAIDKRRFLNRFVDALTTPLGALGPIGDG
ncbi:MAG: nucleoside hydrolase [Chloroflexia bacterium]|nr:nucleoside hydrolase [Chloroflexia bacterium]